ncbi:hypothetical protein H311_02918 [Anncaliia algerae PRA109]|nr:hypothetical protein H311_02918 [Anncaliia algerae PRA109]
MSQSLKTKEEYKKIAAEFISSLSIKCPSNHIGRRISSKNIYNYRCKNKWCKINYNILENTPFKGSKLKIWKAIRIFDCWLFGLKIKDISFILRLNKNTITRYFNHLDENLVKKIL